MSRRRAKRRPELTALIDVLFILLFAALVQARGSAEREVERARTGQDVRDPDASVDAAADAAADAAVDAGSDARVDAGPGIDAGTPREAEHLLRAREAASLLARSATGQRFYVVEVSADGRLTAIVARTADGDGPRTPLDLRLQLAVSGDGSGQGAADGGGRHGPRRICAIVAEHIEAADLERAVFLVVPEAGMGYKLWKALRYEVERCHDDARWLAILIDPGMIPAFGTDDSGETDDRE